MINIDLINPFAEFWPLTLAHKSVFTMNTHVAASSPGREEAEKDLRGRVSQQEMRLVLFLALHNRKHKRKSGKDRSKGLDLRADKNLST